jgi:RNA 2',3'-cyclic 3'-phosphodiesterase
MSLPPHIIANLMSLAGTLKGISNVRWSPAENLHVTTKFIGAWPEQRVPDLLHALDEMPRNGPFPLKIQGLMFFSHALVASIQNSKELNALAKRTDLALAGLGIPAEKREYTPHVTLARATNARTLEPLRMRLETADPELAGEFQADEFHLYESKMSAYTKVATFPLK